MTTSLSHVQAARYRALKDQVTDPTRTDRAFANLRKIGSSLVPGNGSLEPVVVVVGEAPGTTEDQTGVPFVGPAGQQLNDFLLLAEIDWHDCWMTNVVKYMPLGPDGRLRRPGYGETQAGIRYLKRELSILGPRLVILCGSVAYRAVRPGSSVTADHGQAFRYKGSRVYLPVLHPSACLRDPEQWMELTGADFCKIPGLLESPETVRQAHPYRRVG